SILEGAGLALVGVADHEFFVRLRAPDDVPLRTGTEAGTSHASQAAGLEDLDDFRRPCRTRTRLAGTTQEATEGLIRARAAVRVDPECPLAHARGSDRRLLGYAQQPAVAAHLGD